MKIHRFAIFSSALMLTCACVEEPEVTVNPQPQTGSEVQFGLSLGNGVDTRTVYGQETATGFPIYWVDGDRVHIASPHCLNASESVIYEVSCSTATQNFADALTKTADMGLQWGVGYETTDADGNKVTGLHDFYSIYPSAGSTLTASKDGNVTAALTVASTQYASTSTAENIIYAQPGDMGNVMMYAYTQGAKRGEVVDLKYKPFSTVIEFEINAPSEAAGASQTGNIIVQSITLTAPTGTNIAGDFTFIFPSEESATPTITANSASGSSSITVHFLENNQYTTTLTEDKTLKAKMCIMPISDVTSMDGWKITVATSAADFTKTISGTGEATALAPGMVHKIKLPALIYGSQEWNYSLSNWITSLPDYKNIYLTEISLPGAWYTGSDETYQATNEISTLWNDGVRAFAIETRTNSDLNLLGRDIPTNVGLAGTGSAGDNVFFITDGGTNSLHTTTNSVTTSVYESTNINTLISNIATNVNDDEFAVLVLSYADAGDRGLRYVDYGAWLKLLYDTFNDLSAEVKAKIHQETITENTIVSDVLGKLILKINVDENIAVSGFVDDMSFTYGNNLPALFSYNRFAQQIKDYDNPYFSELHWNYWYDSYRKDYSSLPEADFIWCFSSANRTQLDTGTDADIPKYSERQTALSAMMGHSKEIYEASTHNVWFYFNCGGTQATSMTSTNNSPTDFAAKMNSWLLETIQAKTDPSPLGIVMFNQCTGDNGTYKGADIIKEIIDMNSKFYLKHFGDETTTQTAELQSVSPNYSAAVVDTGADAISWE